MELPIRKGRVLLQVRCGSSFTNNLFGEKFTLQVDGDKLTLSIDLSPNLRVRDKRSDQYTDARDLAERHAELELVEIDDRHVINRLVRLVQEWERVRARAPAVYLTLRLGKSFSYRVWLQEAAGTLTLRVVQLGVVKTR